jgi:MFS family permease
MTTLNPSVARPAAWVRTPGHLAVFYLGCLLAAGSYGLTLLLPSLVKAAGGSPAQAGLIYWCGACGAGGALVLSGRLSQRIGAGWSAAAGSVLYAMATAVLAGGGARGGIAYAAGVLLGAGWALFFTCVPIIALALPGRAQADRRFLVLAGFNALGIGAGPIVGQLLVAHGASYRGLFAVAALGSLGSGALLCLVARCAHPSAATSQADRAARGVIGPVRLVLASGARPFVLMAGLGACVFTTMTTYQATLAAAAGVNPSVFYACYTLGVIIPRFTVTSVLARYSPATTTAALLAGMCLSLTGFMLADHDVICYALSSVLLGVTYGLAYPLIQAQAAGAAPAGFTHWSLWYFSLAYFAGLYGFPLIAGTVIGLGGYHVLIAVLLTIAALELALSLKAGRMVQAKRCGSARGPRAELVGVEDAPDVGDLVARDLERHHHHGHAVQLGHQAGLTVDRALEHGHVRYRTGPFDIEARDFLGAFDRVQDGRDHSAAVAGRRGVRGQQADEGVDVPSLPGLLEGPDDAGLVGGRGRGSPRVADAAAGRGGQLTAGRRGPADDLGHFSEGVGEDVVQDERDALGRGHRVEHDQERHADRLIQGDPVGRVGGDAVRPTGGPLRGVG